MTIENPIESHIVGPAQKLDEKAEVLLSTINYHVLRNDPAYCKKTISDIEWLYSKNNKEIPPELKEEISKIIKMLED